MFIRRSMYEYLTERLIKMEQDVHSLHTKNDQLRTSEHKARTYAAGANKEASMWYHAFRTVVSNETRSSDVVIHNGTAYKVVGWSMEQQPDCAETLTLECQRIIPNLEPLEGFERD